VIPAGIIHRLVEASGGSMTVSEGDRIPRFTLTDDRGETFDSDSLTGSPAILYFYPRAFTPGCTTESCDFRDRHNAFADAGYRIVGISPDPVGRLAEFREEHDLPFPLLSDPDHAVAEAFGAWGTKRQYGREFEGLIRSTFLIDATGRATKAWRNVRAKGHAERALSEIS
jgi:peroxiredoxin Q/BCP